MNTYRWLTPLSQKFLDDGYLMPGQSVDERAWIIARTAERILGQAGYADKFMQYFRQGWFSLASPIWSNFGTKRALPISCNGSHISDKTESILATYAEVGMQTKYGAGTSIYMGEIRPRGSAITDNGHSSGSVHFSQMFDKLISIMSQGNVRRGQCAAYWPIDHGDIKEVLSIRTEGSPVQDLSYGVCVSDEWMKAMIAGDSEKRSIWAKVIECRVNTGYPYVFFVDNAARIKADVYKDRDMPIRHSNLCVTGSQRVVTSKGLKTVKQLYDEGWALTLHDNDRPVKASRMELIERNQPVYRISLANGMSHDVTGYHKVKTGPHGLNVACEDLKVGDLVAVQTTKGLFGSESEPVDAFVLGQEEEINIPSWIWQADEKTQWQYIGGLLDAHATYYDTCPIELAFDCWSRPVAQDVQLLLANLGVQSVLGKKGYVAIAETNLLLVDENTPYFRDRNISLPKLYYTDGSFSPVVSVEFIGREDVYCCRVESDQHHWICNGVITSNCSEIVLPTSPDESFVCDLSSANILYFDEWRDTDMLDVLVSLLDAVMTEYIEKARSIPFMERSVRFAERHRAIGIGWVGWHSYLQSKMIAFESMEAKRENILVAKTIRDQTLAASQRLAREYGEPELLKGYGRRHTTLRAIAPTKSSAFILGQVSEGIEPHRSNYYIKDLAKGKFSIRNPHLEQLLREKGWDTDAVWDGILKRGGSVQHLLLSEHEKMVFKTFQEISPAEVVAQAAQRQPYLDQTQSLNLMIDPKTPAKDINRLMINAWESGVVSLYYQIGVNAAQEFARNILACSACEA